MLIMLHSCMSVSCKLLLLPATNAPHLFQLVCVERHVRPASSLVWPPPPTPPPQKKPPTIWILACIINIQADRITLQWFWCALIDSLFANFCQTLDDELTDSTEINWRQFQWPWPLFKVMGLWETQTFPSFSVQAVNRFRWNLACCWFMLVWERSWLFHITSWLCCGVDSF